MRINLTDSEIRNWAASSSSYLRGVTYHVENRVSCLQFDSDALTVSATVGGTMPYDVEITFEPDGEVGHFYCDCPAFANYDGACKHIVAVMVAFQRKLRNSNVSTVPKPGPDGIRENNKAIGEIINLFSGLSRQQAKEPVNFEIFLDVVKPSYYLTASAEFKIGLPRMYIFKNIKEFCNNIAQQKPFEFGKNFTFEPDKHTFSADDQLVIDFLQEMLALENAMYPYSYGSSNSTFSGKTVRLNDFFLKRFLDVLGDRPFNFSYSSGRVVSDATIQEGLPLEFIVEPAGEGLALRVENQALPVAITSGGEYFYYQNNIFRATEAEKKFLFPLLNRYMGLNNKVVFPAAFVEPFVSEVLPCVKEAARVELAPALENIICQEELAVRMYFDRMVEDQAGNMGIVARLEFHYGEHIINPFISVRANSGKPAERIIVVRDSQRESPIFELLEQAGFTVNQGEIHLYEDERVIDFIENTLPKLQDIAEIYYSEDFKGLHIRSSSAYSGDIRLNKDNDLLEFSLQLDEIDNSELEQVLQSVQLKKKYFRLKDGSFLDLQQTELATIASLVEQLGLNAADLQQKTVHLPKYRALYIDSFLRHKQLQGISRNSAFKQLVQSIQEPQDTEYQVPAGVQGQLREYQKTGYRWLRTLAAHGLGGILADDMGLGKTLQVITFILAEKETGRGPALVIAPTSLVFNWYEEVQRFAPSLKTVVVSGTPDERRKLFNDFTHADLVVTSYPLIRRDIDFYKEWEFSYCFLDEAQHIKNPNTINAKSVQQLKARNYFALTGTPIENSLTELWSIFNFAMPGFLLTHKAFQKKYELPLAKAADPDLVTELSRHVQPFILRRLKKDVLKELPDKIETRLTAEMTKEQQKLYLAYLKQAQGEIMQEIGNAGFEKSRIKILALLTRLRQICCHPGLFVENYTGESGKMQLLQEILEDVWSSGHRVLLFSQFTSMLAIIRSHLESQNIAYHYLDGSTKAKDRQQMVRAFNEGQGAAFLISLKAGGTGLNLTGADTVIHYDPWWNPAVEEQATDRAHRIGQKQVVQVFKLVTKGTIEEKIYTLQQKKKELIDAVIHPGETFISKLSEEELKQIFDL